MTYEEAINAIKCNYPPEHYSMLREALDMAMECLEKQTHNCEDCKHADYMKRENAIYCLEHSCMMSCDNCCRDWSDEDE